MQAIPISETFSLTPLDLRDADEFFVLIDSNRDYLRRWLPWLDSIRCVEDTRAFIKSVQVQESQNNGTQLGIRLNGQVVGTVGHHQIDWRNRLTSLGCWIGQIWQSQGVATTACRALVDHAFGCARWNRVEIRCAVANHKSRAIPNRFGIPGGRALAGCRVAIRSFCGSHGLRHPGSRLVYLS
jgi:ribosomal-protein-serine acetyltransferase